MSDSKIIRLNREQAMEPDAMLVIFFLFSFVGWLWEGVFVGVRYGMFINRGFLHGPWLPIYGAAGLLMILLLGDWKHRPAVVYVGSVLLCAIVEYVTGFFLETFYHQKWWDYSNFPLNLQGRICPQDTMFFGVFGMLAVYYIAPWLLDRMRRQSRLRILVCMILTIAFTMDVMLSLASPNMGLGITY
ncbi:MAG: putative ABC transporter permease [Lachnospiraceae bacterium]|nr:putative ABC transporter permease [Lachnospiraceae bacterium]